MILNVDVFRVHMKQRIYRRRISIFHLGSHLNVHNWLFIHKQRDLNLLLNALTLYTLFNPIILGGV